MIPTLSSERLRLRPLAKEDAPRLHEILSDPVAMEHFPQTWDLEGARDWIRRNDLRYERDGHGLWAVTAREDGRFLGTCGLLMQEVDGELHAEIAYHFKRSEWGRGYATEAAGRVMRYAFEEKGYDHVISIIAPANHPSARVAVRNGLQLWKRTSFRFLPLAHVYRIQAEDFAAGGSIAQGRESSPQPPSPTTPGGA